MKIYSPTHEILYAFDEYPSDSVYKAELMKEDYISLKFNLYEPVHFQIGSYLDTEHGRFVVTKLQNPTYDEVTGGYSYNLRLDKYYYIWNNRKFKYTPSNGGREARWSLTADLSTHMEAFLANLSAYNILFNGESRYTFTTDSTIGEEAVAVTYDNVGLVDALTLIAESFGCEWWITDNVINFGRCEFNSSVEFEVGVNVDNMTSSASDSVYATRIYVFGSTRNLTRNYRPNTDGIVVNGIAERRLMLPEGTPYIDARTDPPLLESEIVEDIVVFDDVFPKRVSVVGKVTTKKYFEEIENEDGSVTNEEWTAYRLKDSDSGFHFSHKYILEGETLKLQFTKGSLSGMMFDVTFNPDGLDEKNGDEWNPDAQVFEIVRNEEYGRPIPDNTLKPKISDEFVLFNFDVALVGDEYVGAAERILLDKGLEYIGKSKIDPNTFTTTLISDYAYGLDKDGNLDANFAKDFELGDRVKLVNPAFFESGSRDSRIIGFEKCLDKPYDSPKYTIGESSRYSRLDSISQEIEELTYNGSVYVSGRSGGGASVYVIGSNDMTEPSDRNVYSAKRTRSNFLSKTEEDHASERITFEKGIKVGGVHEEEVRAEFGEYTSGVLGAGGAVRVFTDGSSHAEFDYLEVRRLATFREITIAELKHIGGELCLTPAAIVCSRVEEYKNYYRVYFEDRDEKGNKKIHNPFVEDDQARCQRFDIGAGTSEWARTQYYWRLVVNVGENYIDLSKDDCDEGSGIPMEGDNIVQLGNRSDSARRAAIILSSIENDAPSKKFYAGIGLGDNPYSLEGKDVTSEGYASGKAYQNIYGNFYVGNRNEKAYLKYTDRGGLEVSASKISLLVNNEPKDFDQYITSETAKAFDRLDKAIESQFDGSFEIWRGDNADEPTLDNLPSLEWTDAASKSEHVGDYYINTEGRVWEFVENEGMYSWVLVTDENLISCLNLVKEKRRVFSFTIDTERINSSVIDFFEGKAYDVGDMWANAEWVSGDKKLYDKDILVCVAKKEEGEDFRISDWKPSSAVNTNALLETGIDIGNRSITLTADTTKIQSNKGEQIALFNIDSNGKPTISTTFIVADYVKVGEDKKEKILLMPDGSGKLASGKINWNASGNMSIAGWNVNTSTISKGNVTLGSDGSISAKNGSTTYWSLNNDGSGSLAKGAITWNESGLSVKGHIEATSGSFTGTVTATNSSFSGSIDAGSGSIGGWTIANSAISNGNVKLGSDGTISASSDVSTYWSLNNDGSGSLAKGAVSWTKDGDVTLSNKVSISWSNISDTEDIDQKLTYIDSDGIYTGELTAEQVSAVEADFTQGTIGGWTINTDSISGGNVVIDSGGSIYSKSGKTTYWSLDDDGSATFSKGTILFNPNGSASFANGNISLNADGSGSIAGGAISWDASGEIEGIEVPSVSSASYTVDGKTGISGVLNVADGTVLTWTGGILTSAK